MTLVDANIVIDILRNDPVWLRWSAARLAESREAGAASVNEIVYAEVAARVGSREELDGALAELGLGLQRIPLAGLFLAGRAFARYRAAGGPRQSLLPDFFIGAHAAATGLPILTRDPRRYRSYFPDVALIAPDG